MKNTFHILCLVATLALSGCLETEGSSDEPPANADAGVSPDTSVGWPEPDSGEEECVVESHADSDQDGLLDILEDANRNCRVDADETDPFTTDTDGDGLVDGDEDIDRNGQWDDARGELDPRRRDTDSNGIPDGEEPIAAVCNSTLTDAALETVVFGDREFHPNRIPLTTEARETSVWVEFEGGGADWLSVDPAVDAGPLVTQPDRRVFFESHSDAGFFELSEWAVEASDALFRALLESQTVPYTPETIELTEGPYEVSRHLLPDGRSRLAVRPAGGEAGNRSATALRAFPGGTLRPRCVEVTPLPPLDSVDVVFVFATDEETLFAAGQVIEGLVSALESRAAAGFDTRLWLVRADAHVHSSAGAPIGSRGFEEATDVRPILAELEAGGADQRVWMNARAALQSLAMGRLQGTPILVTLGSREDTEYREGSTEGYDGHAYGEPHPANEQREALDSYYSEFFDANVGDRQVHMLAGGCEETRPWPLSARTLSAATFGTYGDLCGEFAWQHLESALLRIAGAAGYVPVEDAALDGFSIGPESFEGTTAGETGLGWVPGAETGPIHVGYLFWDPVAQ